jgi:hypothetical protein
VKPMFTIPKISDRQSQSTRAPCMCLSFTVEDLRCSLDLTIPNEPFLKQSDQFHLNPFGYHSI